MQKQKQKNPSDSIPTKQCHQYLLGIHKDL